MVWEENSIENMIVAEVRNLIMLVSAVIWRNGKKEKADKSVEQGILF